MALLKRAIQLLHVFSEIMDVGISHEEQLMVV